LFGRGTEGREVGTGSRAPLKEHAFGLGERENGIERIAHGIDEAGRALRRLVAGDAEFYAAESGIPVPVRGIRVRLDTIATHVEPYGRVESGILANEQMHQFVMESVAVFRGAEVSLGQAPVPDRFGNPAHQLARARLTLRRTDRPMQIFGSHDVGGRHGPVFGNLDILLLENNVALRV